MIEALLYQVRVRMGPAMKAEVTFVPTWLGRLLKRCVRRGAVYRAGGNDDRIHWWWTATDRHVGAYVERHIETAPTFALEDMTAKHRLGPNASEGPQAGMATLQFANEKTSIERFVADTTGVAREHGTDAGTTCVIIAAAQTAANMAPRRADGTIDAEIARAMLRRVARGLARIR